MTRTTIYKGIAITSTEVSKDYWRVTLSTTDNILGIRAKSYESVVSKIINRIDKEEWSFASLFSTITTIVHTINSYIQYIIINDLSFLLLCIQFKK